MHIAFVTFGNYTNFPTLKRATGMAGPLREMGFKVSLLLEDSADNREKVARECPQAEVYYHHRGHRPIDERREKQARLDQLRPDIIWICAVGARTWVKRTHRGSIVIADHSELPSAFVRDPIRKAYEYLCEWGHILAFDAHVCASRYLENFYARRMRRLGKSPRVHYSPYAYDAYLLNQERRILAELKSAYTRPKTIVYMGGFWENYGFWDMLHVFRDLFAKREDLQVLMLGKGPEKEAGEKWLRDQKMTDRCHLVGYAPEEDLSSYFTFADLFLCPLRDTLQDIARCPSKLYMYLPFNKPIVTSPIGEAKELFGARGHYYTPGDRAELSAAIETALDAERWQNPADPNEHSWTARTRDFVSWLEAQNFSK